MVQDDSREHSSWRDDIRLDAVHEFLTQAISAAGLEEIDREHIVVCRDTETGAVSYSGPFADGISALTFAENESALDRDLNDGVPLSFSVAALCPAPQPSSG